MVKYLGSLFGFVMIIVGIITFMFVTGTGIKVIDGWEVGVKKTGTTYSMTELQPGYKFFIPIYEEVIEINARPILFNYSDEDKDKPDTEEIRYGKMIEGVDKNGIPMWVAVAIEVKPIKNMMAEMYQADGTFENGLDKKVIQPNKSVIRDIMGKFDVKTVQSKRLEFTKQLNEAITIEYNENKYFALVGRVDLKQIELPQKVRDGQISVQLAAQQSEVSARLIEKAKNEAKSVEEVARGKANAYKIESQGKADAILIEATAKAQANNLLSKSITDKILRADTIEAWKSGGAQVPHLVGSEKSQYILPLK